VEDEYEEHREAFVCTWKELQHCQQGRFLFERPHTESHLWEADALREALRATRDAEKLKDSFDHLAPAADATRDDLKQLRELNSKLRRVRSKIDSLLLATTTLSHEATATPKATWRRLREYSFKQKFDSHLPRRAWYLPEESHLDFLREECATSLRQAEDLVEASHSVGLAAKPLPLYYAVIKLAHGMLILTSRDYGDAVSKDQVKKGHGAKRHQSRPAGIRELGLKRSNRGLLRYLAEALSPDVDLKGEYMLPRLLSWIPELAALYEAWSGQTAWTCRCADFASLGIVTVPGWCTSLPVPASFLTQTASITISEPETPASGAANKLYRDMVAAFPQLKLLGSPHDAPSVWPDYVWIHTTARGQEEADMRMNQVYERSLYSGRYLTYNHGDLPIHPFLVLLMAAFILCDTARYLPSTWQHVIDAEEGQLVAAAADTIAQKAPILALEHIERCYYRWPGG